MRLVSPICTTKPASDRYIVMLARNAVMPSSLAPVASATMFTCCSTMVEPAAASPITSAITRKWGDCASIRRASAPPTPRSSSSSDCPALCRRRMTVTMPVQHANVAALTSSRLRLPISSTSTLVRPAPSAPPRLAPPPMKPNTRFAWRAS